MMGVMPKAACVGEGHHAQAPGADEHEMSPS